MGDNTLLMQGLRVSPGGGRFYLAEIRLSVSGFRPLSPLVFSQTFSYTRTGCHGTNVITVAFLRLSWGVLARVRQEGVCLLLVASF